MISEKIKASVTPQVQLDSDQGHLRSGTRSGDLCVPANGRSPRQGAGMGAEQRAGSQLLSSPQPHPLMQDESAPLQQPCPLATCPGSDASGREAGRQRRNINDLDFPGGTELTKQTQPGERMKLKETRVYFLPNYMQGRAGS